LFSKELTGLIVDVLTSWQVIAAALGVVIYIAVLNNAARLYRVGRPKLPKGKKSKKEKPEKETEETAEMDDLGLED
jgi:hypothetical protein